LNQAGDIVRLDIRNAGDLLESKKIADLAELFYLPMAAHNTESAINAMATVLAQGHITVPQKPSLVIELNQDVVRANLAEGERCWD